MHSMEMAGFVGFGRRMIDSLSLRKRAMTYRVQKVVQDENCRLYMDLEEVVAGQHWSSAGWDVGLVGSCSTRWLP